MTESSSSPSIGIVAVVATTAAGLIASALLYNRLGRRKNQRDPSKEFVILTKQENAFLQLGMAPISTLTWLEVKDVAQVKDQLSKRLLKVLQANPWLLGKFVRDQGVYGMEYNNSVSEDEDLSEVFLVDTTAPLDSSLPLQKQCQSVDKLLLKPKQEFSQPFLRVVLLPRGTASVGLIVSLSHVVGDGHTFYQLHNMLLGSVSVTSLTVSRLTTTETLAEQTLGKLESNIMTSPSLIVTMLRGVLLNKVVGPLTGTKAYSIQSRCFLVDPKKMAELKEQHSSKVDFLSSNDVIASWFFSKNPHSLMAINLRDKLEDHTNDRAGNYESVIYYRTPEDTHYPELIRQSLSNELRRLSFETSPCRPSEFLWSNLSILTNWASFMIPKVDLEGVTLQKHMPASDLTALIPSTLATCIVFQYAPGQLAVLVAGTPEVMRSLEQAPFEGERLE